MDKRFRKNFRPMYIGKNIKYLRIAMEMSQRELGEVIEQSHTAISVWEAGDREPNLQNLLMLCNYFNVNLDDFVFKDLGQDDEWYDEQYRYNFRKEETEPRKPYKLKKKEVKE